MNTALKGRSIVVTRARQQASRLGRELEMLGARVIEIPAIEMAPPDSYEPLDTALRNLQQYEWLIVTSANTVRVLRERASLLGLPAGAFFGPRTAVVGAATAETLLRELGLHADILPQKYVGEGLLDALREHVSGRRVLLARAAVARDVLPDGLRQLAAAVDVVDAYKTIVPASSAKLAQEAFASAALPDAVLFSSSSTVTNFFQLLGAVDLPKSVRLVSIGPITSATLREYDREPDAEADPHDVDGLVQAVVRIFAPA